MSSQVIPAHAHKVHKGPSFEVYQRQQKLFDGSHKTYELAHMANSVKVILIDRREEKIIMVRDEQPNQVRITFAGGLVEEGESTLDAAHREVLEETGYRYRSYYDRFTLPYTHRVCGVTHYYIAWDLTHTETINPDKGSEKITLLPMSFEDFINHITNPLNNSHFSYYLIKHYLFPGKLNELKELLFGKQLSSTSLISLDSVSSLDYF